MTDIAPNAGDFIRPHKSPWGGFPMLGMPLSTGVSSLAIVVGTICTLDTDSSASGHQIKASSLTSNTVVSTATVGVSAENPTAIGSTNVQGTVIALWDCNPMVEFRGRTRNGLLNSTLVGQQHTMLWDSTMKIHLINVGGSSITSGVGLPVTITSLIDNVGDSGGAVTFRFNSVDRSQGTTSVNNFLAFYK